MDRRIEITMAPTPIFGTTTHDATLVCEHGQNTWAVFGDEDRRFEMARSMAAAHRSLCRCACEVTLPVVAAS